MAADRHGSRIDGYRPTCIQGPYSPLTSYTSVITESRAPSRSVECEGNRDRDRDAIAQVRYGRRRHRAKAVALNAACEAGPTSAGFRLLGVRLSSQCVASPRATAP